MSDRTLAQALAEHEKHGEKTVYDSLGHDELAGAIVNHIGNMPPGSVIAVQGAWGRGKTDVVKRVHRLFCRKFKKGEGPEPIWIDPWQYGRPDLIQPVVIELLRRSPKDKPDLIKGIAQTLLLASNAMAFKAVSVFVPFGAIIAPAEDPVKDLINRAFGSEGPHAEVEADPVAAMAGKFRELVEATASADPDKRLLICVDDLDRCLPDNQIAMLEAIHFLTSADANCTFLIAIDPFLVQQAALAHYSTSNIDINQYLDKIFHLRINLRSLLPAQIGEIVKAELDNDTVRQGFDKGLQVGPAAVQSAFIKVFDLPELTNPRLVHRTIERLRLAAAANVRHPNPTIQGDDVLVPLVVWCAIAERWPQLRQLLQGTSNDLKKWHGNIKAICGHYDLWDEAWGDDTKRKQLAVQAASAIERLPGRRQQPDLGQFLKERLVPEINRGPKQLRLFRDIDAALVSSGL